MPDCGLGNFVAEGLGSLVIEALNFGGVVVGSRLAGPGACTGGLAGKKAAGPGALTAEVGVVEVKPKELRFRDGEGPLLLGVIMSVPGGRLGTKMW
jgi:hypothetical protein